MFLKIQKISFLYFLKIVLVISIYYFMCCLYFFLLPVLKKNNKIIVIGNIKNIIFMIFENYYCYLNLMFYELSVLFIKKKKNWTPKQKTVLKIMNPNRP